MDGGFDRYSDAFFSTPELLDLPPRDGPERRRRRRQAMKHEVEAIRYRQLMDNQVEMNQYR